MCDPSPFEYAKLAEQAERYEDMVAYMKEFAEKADKELTSDQRNMLSVAYKNVAGSCRAAHRVLSSPSNDERAPMTEVKAQYKKKIKDQLHKICYEVLDLLKNHLIVKATDTDAVVFFHKMKGDYYRYLAESEDGEKEKADVVQQASDAYSQASTKAEDLPATHPIRLGLALNYSVFFYEIQNTPKEACALAKKAFDEAIAELDSLKEESYKDSTLIMQLLRDNLTLWTTDDESQETQDSNQ